MADFNGVSQQIAAHDFVKDYVNSIDDGKLQTKNAFDKFTSGTKSVLKWCDFTIPHLDELIEDDGESQAQRNLLAATLTDGL